MKTYHYILIALALVAGWYFYKKHKHSNTEDPDTETSGTRTLEELKALPQFSKISYEEAKLFDSEVYFDNPITPEQSYSVRIRNVFDDSDLSDLYLLISQKTANQLIKDGRKSYTWDFSRNGDRFAEFDYEEAMELAKKYPNDISVAYESGDGPEYEYSAHVGNKGGLCSRRTFVALLPKAKSLSIN